MPFHKAVRISKMSEEELLRFVAVRAPERQDPVKKNVLSLEKTASKGFLEGLRAEDKNPRELAKTFIEKGNFVNPEDTDIPFIPVLLGLYDTMSTAPQNSDYRSIVENGLVSLLKVSNATNLKDLLASNEWKSMLARVSDSLVALGFFQKTDITSATPYERILAVADIYAEAHCDGTDKATGWQLNAVPALNSPLVRPAKPREGDKEEEKEDLSEQEAMLGKVETLRKAIKFMISLPAEKFDTETIERETNENNDALRRNDEDAPKFRRAFARTTFKIKDSSFMDAPELREVVALKSKQFGLANTVESVLRVLRHDERQIYSNLVAHPSFQVRGTLLTNPTVVRNQLFGSSISRKLFNPTALLRPKLKIPSLDFIMKPRYGFLGLGELLVVRQKLMRYRARDVSYIENVLRGQSKEREHRRKRTTEETLFREEEIKKEEQHDLQTTTRFELKNEVTNEVESKLKAKGGVKVKARLGPFVEMEANAGISYEQAKKEGRKKAVSFSRETIEKASSKYSERVLESRRLRLVEEVEETNKHVLSGGSTSNLTGIYQWVEKQYQAQVYNYGLREMYEFFLPEPALYYIQSLVTKGEVDGNHPKPPPEFTVQPSDIEPSNYLTYAALFNASEIPQAPEDFTRIGEAKYGDAEETNRQFSTGFTIDIPDGYEYAGYNASWYYWYYDGGVFSFSGSSSFNDPGKVPFTIFGKNVSVWTLWVEVTCRVTESYMNDWRLKVWGALLTGYNQMKNEYEEAQATAAVQEGVEIVGRNPLANERIVRDEIQRQCLSAFTNSSLGDQNGIVGSNVNWFNAYERGLFARFMQQAFEWQNMSYVFYPYFWARKVRWLELFNIEDTDPEFQEFLQSGMARVVVPVRPGFEGHVEHFKRSGKVWSGRSPPIHGDPDFVSVITEIKEQKGAPGDEEPVGEPWTVTLPTNLVAVSHESHLPDFSEEFDASFAGV